MGYSLLLDIFKLKEMSFFQKNITALCQAITEEYRHVFAITNHQQAEKFLREQMKKMPDYLKLPFALLNSTFFLLVLMRYFKPFYCLSSLQQSKLLSQWRNSKINVCRTFIKFYESLIIYDLSFQTWRKNE